MAWRRPGDKALSGLMMVEFIDAYMRHSASMSSHSSAARFREVSSAIWNDVMIRSTKAGITEENIFRIVPADGL